MQSKKKTISSIVEGTQENVGEFKIVRTLPNKKYNKVGPFVLLDHFPKKHFPARTARKQDGSEAHPHKGFATVSYAIEGEFVHYDSRGNNAITSSGGLQWMNAGSGIVHDGGLSEEFQTRGGTVNAFQIWVNIPAVNKFEAPQYLSIKPNAIPIFKLPGGSGQVRLLLGAYHGKSSSVPSYSEQILLHVKLASFATFIFEGDTANEHAVYPANGRIEIDQDIISTHELAKIETYNGPISIRNPDETPTDFIILGGAPYTEPIAFGGPFVMNSQAEIQQAMREYQSGQFGTISYSELNDFEEK